MSPLLPSSCISTLPQTSPSTRGDWSSCDHSRKNLLPTSPKNCNYCTCVLLYGILLPQFFLMFHTHTHTSQSSSGLNSNTYVLRMQPLFFLKYQLKISLKHPPHLLSSPLPVFLDATRLSSVSHVTSHVLECLQSQTRWNVRIWQHTFFPVFLGYQSQFFEAKLVK